jgi:hypothetical protein
MKKFIVTYHAPMDALQQSAESSPEEMEKGMQAWMAWAQKCGDKLVDMGTPLANGLTLGPDGSHVSSDRGVCGYSILQAENMEEARGLLKDHPHMGWNAACQIEVHESLPVPGSQV